MPYADYYPRGINNYVPSCEYSIDTDMDNRLHTVDFGAPLALSTNGLLLTAAIATAATTFTAFTSGAGNATAIGYNGMVPMQARPCSSISVVIVCSCTKIVLASNTMVQVL